MTPEQFLNEVSREIDRKRPASPGSYTLELFEGLPLIMNGQTCPKSNKILAHLTSADINNGLTTRMWNRIKDRYAIFTKGNQ